MMIIMIVWNAADDCRECGTGREEKKEDEKKTASF